MMPLKQPPSTDQNNDQMKGSLWDNMTDPDDSYLSFGYSIVGFY